MFRKDIADTSKTNIGSDCIDHTDQKIYTITVEPVPHYITCETTEKILGYRDLVKIDALLWTNYTCNELGPLSQCCKSHTGTDTKNHIFHKDKTKDKRVTYVRAICDI